VVGDNWAQWLWERKTSSEQKSHHCFACQKCYKFSAGSAPVGILSLHLDMQSKSLPSLLSLMTHVLHFSYICYLLQSEVYLGEILLASRRRETQSLHLQCLISDTIGEFLLDKEICMNLPGEPPSVNIIAYLGEETQQCHVRNKLAPGGWLDWLTTTDIAENERTGPSIYPGSFASWSIIPSKGQVP